MLVPGLACSPRLWAPVLPAVWAAGPVTIADTRRDATIPGMAERLLTTVPGRFVLAGLSMGGYVALEVARRAPERLAGLALLSTSARPDTPERTAVRREELALARDGRYDEVVDASFPRLVAPARAGDDDLRATCAAMAEEAGPETFRRQQEAIIARADSRPLLGSIACPALVVHGALDALIDAEHGRELAAGIPGARLEVLAGCGHLVTLERPAETAAALATLLGS